MTYFGGTGGGSRAPADVHRAILGILRGAPQTWAVPPLAAARVPCVQRTIDLLDLYGLLAESAQLFLTGPAQDPGKVRVQGRLVDVPCFSLRTFASTNYQLVCPRDLYSSVLPHVQAVVLSP